MLFMARLVFLLLTLSFSSLSYTQVADWASGGKLKPEQAVMDIRHYTLTLNVDPSTKTIDGSTGIDLVLTEAAPVLLFDLIDRYKITEVTVDGKKSPYVYESDL